MCIILWTFSVPTEKTISSLTGIDMSITKQQIKNLLNNNNMKVIELKNSVSSEEQVSANVVETDIFREFVKGLIEIAVDIFDSKKPFGFARIKGCYTEHIFGIYMWGEDIDNTYTSTIYLGETDIFREVWDNVVEQIHKVWFNMKIAEGIETGKLDINFIKAKTDAEAREYMQNIATIEEGYFAETQSGCFH